MQVLAYRIRKGQGRTLIAIKGFHNAQRTDVHVFLEQHGAALPNRNAHAAGRNIQEQRRIVRFRKAFLHHVVIQREVLVVNFLRHVDHFHHEAGLDENLIQNTATIFCLSDHRRAIHLVIRYAVLLHESFVTVQHAANLFNGLEGQALAVK